MQPIQKELLCMSVAKELSDERLTETYRFISNSADN